MPFKNVKDFGSISNLNLNTDSILSIQNNELKRLNANNASLNISNISAQSGLFSLSGASPLSLPNNPLSIVGSGNTYIQVNIENRATGTTATADLVLTANNGTDAANYINLGINNSGYNDPKFSNGSAYDGYLFINGGNLDIGTQTPNTNIEFHAGGTTASKVIARINESGLNLVSGNLTVNNTGVLLTGQNIFVLQGGTTQTTAGANGAYVGLAGANIGWSSTATNRRIPILENCVCKKASITLQQGTAQTPISNITGSIINLTKSLTGIISTSMNTTSDDNFYTFIGSDFNVPFTSGDNAVVLIHSTSSITNTRCLANVYFYN